MEVSIVDKKQAIRLQVLLMIALVLVFGTSGITSLIWYLTGRLQQEKVSSIDKDFMIRISHGIVYYYHMVLFISI